MGAVEEDPLKQIDRRMMEQAEEYASCDEDSKVLNDRRKQIRDNIESMGLHPLAWQHAVGMIKRMTPGERRDYQTSYQRIIGVLGDKQMDLFPDAGKKAQEREERRAEQKAKAGTPRAEQDAKSDANPRSDPKTGGAGQQPAKGGSKADAVAGATPQPETPPAGPGDPIAAAMAEVPQGHAEPPDPPQTLHEITASGDKLIKATLAKKQHAAEQAEGEKLLSGVGKKPSQSELSKRKLETAGLH